MAIWRPANTPVANAQTYPYCIDIGKIAAKLKVGFLAWLPRFDYNLPCGTTADQIVPPPPGFNNVKRFVPAHAGFLGSVYDLAHAAEV